MNLSFVSHKIKIFYCRSYETGYIEFNSVAGHDAQCIAEHFASSRQAVSKHIKILTACDLLEQQQHGREIYYHFNAKKMKDVDLWLEQFRQIWETRFNQLD